MQCLLQTLVMMMFMWKRIIVATTMRLWLGPNWWCAGHEMLPCIINAMPDFLDQTCLSQLFQLISFHMTISWLDMHSSVDCNIIYFLPLFKLFSNSFQTLFKLFSLYHALFLLTRVEESICTFDLMFDHRLIDRWLWIVFFVMTIDESRDKWIDVEEQELDVK